MATKNAGGRSLALPPAPALSSIRGSEIPPERNFRIANEAAFSQGDVDQRDRPKIENLQRGDIIRLKTPAGRVFFAQVRRRGTLADYRPLGELAAGSGGIRVRAIAGEKTINQLLRTAKSNRPMTRREFQTYLRQVKTQIPQLQRLGQAAFSSGDTPSRRAGARILNALITLKARINRLYLDGEGRLRSARSVRTTRYQGRAAPSKADRVKQRYDDDSIRSPYQRLKGRQRDPTPTEQSDAFLDDARTVRVPRYARSQRPDGSYSTRYPKPNLRKLNPKTEQERRPKPQRGAD